MSARHVEGFSDSFKAGEALTSKQGFAATLSSGNIVGVSSAGGVGIGVAMDAAANAAEVGVEFAGLHPVSYGGTVAVLGEFTPDSAGEMVASVNDDDYIFGRALEAAVDGDYETALLHPPRQHVPLRNVDGRGQLHLLRATYDISGGDDGAVGVHTLAEKLPDNAVVVRAYYYVATTFTDSDDDSATMALGITTDDAAGLLAAVAISDGGNPWDAGWHECIQDGTAANFSEPCTAERALIVTVADDEIDAGKLILFCEYVIID